MVLHNVFRTKSHASPHTMLQGMRCRFELQPPGRQWNVHLIGALQQAAGGVKTWKKSPPLLLSSPPLSHTCTHPCWCSSAAMVKPGRVWVPSRSCGRKTHAVSGSVGKWQSLSDMTQLVLQCTVFTPFARRFHGQWAARGKHASTPRCRLATAADGAQGGRAPRRGSCGWSLCWDGGGFVAAQ